MVLVVVPLRIGQMGDRFQRKRCDLGARLMAHRGKPPPSLLAWGLAAPAAIGHNNGPPLDEAAPGYVWRRYRWKKVHAAVWKTPSMGVLRFRVARAEAAGLDYRTYMLTLLDTGRHAQAEAVDARRAVSVARLQVAWADVLSRVAPDASRTDRSIWFSTLIAAYDVAGRHYHDSVHIAAMVSDLEAHGPTDQPRDALVLAILFHDLVYDPTRTDNETESAARARLILRTLGVEPALLARVSELIEATAHLTHTPASADSERDLLLDLDLAILAAPEPQYQAYAAAIRREYAHVPDAAFQRGRAAVLKHFLDQPILYRTAALKTLWEARARQNLVVELDALATLVS